MPRKRKQKSDSTIDTSDYGYKTVKARDKDGKLRHMTSNGDAIAQAMGAHKLAGKSLDQLVKANKLDPAKFNEKRFPNVGMLRMSIGNSLRALVRHGTAVTIGDVTVKTLNQRVAKVKDAA